MENSSTGSRTVLEVTELPDLPSYSTAGAERMSESGSFSGHGPVYRRAPWSFPASEPPAQAVFRGFGGAAQSRIEAKRESARRQSARSIAHRGEQHDLADRVVAGHQEDQPVDPDADAAGRRHALLERL